MAPSVPLADPGCPDVAALAPAVPLANPRRPDLAVLVCRSAVPFPIVGLHLRHCHTALGPGRAVSIPQNHES